MYTTGRDGISLFESTNQIDWIFQGTIFKSEGFIEYWAPCVYQVDSTYYLYFSMEQTIDSSDSGEQLYVASAPTPRGPFKLLKAIVPPFSIDPHVVKSGDSLFLFYSKNILSGDKPGTVIVVDKMISPLEVEGDPQVLVSPTIEEEIFQKDRFKDGKDWYTIEGPFYFRKDDWHYLMYSGSCFEMENYFIGYATCQSQEDDLTKLSFVKQPSPSTFNPLIFRDNNEEGTGHNSLLPNSNGDYTVFYHGREKDDKGGQRTARSAIMQAIDGKLIIESKTL